MKPGKEEFQAVLEERHGKALQKKISQTRVAVCGLGGLGSHVAEALARVGIGTLILIDFDRVDVSNLHRQQYKVSQIGQLKTKALAENLREMAPYIEIITYTLKLTEDNGASILQQADIICEALDDAEAKAMLVNIVLEQLPDKYLVAASGMAGLGPANAITTRRITDHFYLCGDGVSDVNSGAGLVCSRVMLCAAHEAHTILRIIAGQQEE